MSAVETYVMRILCSAVFCGIVLSMFPQGKMKDFLRLLTGLFLTVTLLRPGFEIPLPNLAQIGSDYLQEGRNAAAEGQIYVRRQRHRFIKEALEAYILDKAEMLGCDVSVQVLLDEEGYPKQVILSGSISKDDRRELEIFLTEELGIAKEDQQWNG